MTIYDSITLWAGKALLDVLIFSGVLAAFAILTLALWIRGRIKDARKSKEEGE